jgi:ferric-dicitrate binding protein FerR (iron transport regulator)
VLTLGNGKKVVLDSAGNGMLATQGNDRIMKQNGELDYRSQGGADDAGANPVGSKNAGTKDAGTTAAVFNTLTTPKGGQYKLVLPDGTRVWLDADSSITYPIAFAGKTRRVTISGQAYFDVVHNPSQPFQVDALGQTVSDIGTSFNINAYTDEPAMKITLESGAAAVGGAGAGAARMGATGAPGHEIVLKQPGQQAEYSNGQLHLAPQADLKEVLAWKNGLFHLTSADIATVMRQISRWYDVEVVFEKGIPGGHITGEVPRNAMLSTTLQVLQTSGVHFRTEGKTIYVTP